MAKEMQDDERSVFALHGATGLLLAVVLLLSILVFLTTNAVSIQKEQSQNVYQIKDISNLQMIAPENVEHYELVK
jgi:succinate dehydrogenase/fumarate reductase cytochrome b subunit